MEGRQVAWHVCVAALRASCAPLVQARLHGVYGARGRGCVEDVSHDVGGLSVVRRTGGAAGCDFVDCVMGLFALRVVCFLARGGRVGGSWVGANLMWGGVYETCMIGDTVRMLIPKECLKILVMNPESIRSVKFAGSCAPCCFILYTRCTILYSTGVIVCNSERAFSRATPESTVDFITSSGRQSGSMDSMSCFANPESSNLLLMALARLCAPLGTSLSMSLATEQ